MALSFLSTAILQCLLRLFGMDQRQLLGHLVLRCHLVHREGVAALQDRVRRLGDVWLTKYPYVQTIMRSAICKPHAATSQQPCDILALPPCPSPARLVPAHPVPESLDA